MPKTLVINGVDFPIEGEEVIRDGETLPVLEAIIALPGSVPVTLTAVGSTPAAAGASLSGQALTLQPANGSLPGVLTAAAQTVGGVKTFSSVPVAAGLSAPAATALTETSNVANSGTNVAFIRNAGTALTGTTLLESVRNNGVEMYSLADDGAGTFAGALAASNLSGTQSGTNTGDVTLAAVGAVPNANGATLAAQVLNLQPADATFPGTMSAADKSKLDAFAANTEYVLKTGVMKITLSAAAEVLDEIVVSGVIEDLAGLDAASAQEIMVRTLAVTDGKGDITNTAGVGTFNKIVNPATGPNTAWITTTAAGAFAFTVQNDAAEITLVEVTCNGALAATLKLTYA